MSSEQQTLIGELWSKAETAHQLNVVPRTIDRYEREANGLPFLLIGGRKYHNPASVRAWVAAREKYPNPPKLKQRLKATGAKARV